MWLAGGGIKGGTVYGATDEFGFKAVEKPVHIHDLHATILYLMGIDHTKLTYRYSGRDFRLTDVAGQVVKEIVAWGHVSKTSVTSRCATKVQYCGACLRLLVAVSVCCGADIARSSLRGAAVPAYPKVDRGSGHSRVGSRRLDAAVLHGLETGGGIDTGRDRGAIPASSGRMDAAADRRRVRP